MMSTFTQLSPLLDLCTSLVLILSKQGDMITVVTQPRPNASSPDGLRTQLSLTGTAQDLDAEFPDALQNHATQMKSIGAQVAEAAAQIEAEKQRLAKDAEAKRPKSIKAPAAPTGTDDANDNDSDEDEDNCGTPSGAPAAFCETSAPNDKAALKEIELF